MLAFLSFNIITFSPFSILRPFPSPKESDNGCVEVCCGPLTSVGHHQDLNADLNADVI